ncbi:MAG TPA: hypothetical protein VFS00_04230 [Polyangiaceae bacterium]|nr:hypothetical protein [Polyangiaceae bacterium]
MADRALLGRRARRVLAAGGSEWLPDDARLGRAAAGDDEASRNYLAALAEAALIVMTADRVADEQACADVAELMAEALGEALGRPAVEALVREAAARLGEKGRFARLNALAPMVEDADGRRHVAGFAALLALCDHDLTPSELFVLHALGRAAGFGAERTAEMVHTVGARLNQVGRGA